ncbi:hypothetical protein AHF37_09906 [Paragonimus kellicotti]|nr:hypothetical protein AHF37_09906 [Paragonimus kellicotti]
MYFLSNLCLFSFLLSFHFYRLVTLRAEFEVVERQAELRIKALEHELAKEKLQSAQDRWLAVQLKNQQDRRNGNESGPSTSVWNHSIPLPLCPFSNYGDPFESMRTHTWTAADLSAIWPLFDPVTERSNHNRTRLECVAYRRHLNDRTVKEQTTACPALVAPNTAAYPPHRDLHNDLHMRPI